MTTPQDRELDDLLYEMLPCISCGIDADPADGFGNCTCGNEKRRYQAKQALLDWHNKRELEARIDSLEYAKISPKFKIEEKIEQLRLEAEL